MTGGDPELRRLLVHELERYLPALEGSTIEAAEVQRAVHALRGSAGLAGHRELADALERTHRRMREGEEAALKDAASLVRTAIARLSAGESAMTDRWPVPPDDLARRPVDPLVGAQYAAEVTDRLARIDDALVPGRDPVDAVRAIYRHVHTMKGAGSAVGDEPMTWFCHGLEDLLRGADSTEAALAALQEVAKWRGVLGALLEDPDATLATLRTGRAGTDSRPPVSGPPKSAGSDPPRSTGFDEATATIRVAAADVDRLLEGLDVIDRARERIAARAGRGGAAVVTLRRLRGSLVEAMRLIGPPRPWGAPAAALHRVEHVASALGAFGEEIDAASSRLGAMDHVLREQVADAKKQLSAMRQTTVGRMFGRLTSAIESEARRRGCAVIVRTRGAEETIDRRIAEQLIEPCLQLVRNAVAHGIEAPGVRASLGKPASGTIVLGARKMGSRLSITIEDDGAGVDVVQVRARALAEGLVASAIAEATDDDTLLSLLFLPGFSTRETSDLLAGRGIGLDIARAGIQRLRGAVRLSSRAGKGFRARIDIPIGSGLVTVLWVTAGKNEFALPAATARRVRMRNDSEVVIAPHLLECVDGAHEGAARYIIDLELESDDAREAPAAVGVDAVGHTEELLVRPLGPLVASLGPFAGGIVRGDGSLRFAIDPWAVAPRARALSAAASIPSPPPSRV
jgi:chemotaxis protein histidine kinase CheA